MIYSNKSVLVASKHRKEQAIEPVFRQQLACNVFVEDIDTDQFGTFTGEVPRTLSAIDTCILKATYAANKKNYALSIANEGSFGPHPSIPFVAHAHEIMAFIDLRNNRIITEQLTTTNTNYKMMTITPQTPLNSFLESIHFPSHGLTLQSKDRRFVIEKGINDPGTLNTALSIGFQQHDELLIATDMRAMMNPTRMQSLAVLAEKLVTRIKNLCPNCSTPGFGFKSVSGQLPCRACDHATGLYQFAEWGCIQCDYLEQRARHDQLMAAEPTYCNNCNP